MNTWGRKSLEVRAELHPLLQILMDRVLERFDICLNQGTRDKETQNRYFRKGLSKLAFPHSKHNKFPSHAVDFCTYKNGSRSFDENDLLFISGYMLGVAAEMGIPLRVGSLWSRKFPSQTSFKDYVHIELDM